MNAQRPQNRNKAENNLRELAPLMNIGLELAGIVGVCGAIGYGIDLYASTAPFWFVAMLIFGVIGGMIKFVQIVLRFTEGQSAQKRKSISDTATRTKEGGERED